jgi:hypothetical protein
VVEFRECSKSGYRPRTMQNASADATIAIAVNFNTAGERLTKTSVLTQGKMYIPLDANDFECRPDRIEKIVSRLNTVEAKSLNIAGNGIYTIAGKYTQEQVDDFTYNLLKAVTSSPNLLNNITLIRTGGQTGFDEAGAKAGIRLAIPTLVLAPKSWTFRNSRGIDISDKSQFIARFGYQEESSPDLSLFFR